MRDPYGQQRRRKRPKPQDIVVDIVVSAAGLDVLERGWPQDVVPALLPGLAFPAHGLALSEAGGIGSSGVGIFLST